MVGVSLDDLQVEFEGFNIKVDDQGGNRLIELCEKFAWSAEDIFNQWMAYASIKKLEGQPLSLDLLGPFEAWMGQSSKPSNTSHSTPKAVKKDPRFTSTPSRAPLSASNGLGAKFEENLDADIDIASGYTTPQNRDKLAKRLHTTPEDEGVHKRIISENGSPHVARAPKVELFRGDVGVGSPSSPMTPSLNYRQRTNKGKVLESFNCDSSSFPQLSSSSGLPILVGTIDPSTGQLLHQSSKSSFQYMMQRPQEVADILDNAIDELLESIVVENRIADDGGGGDVEASALTLAHAGVIHHERVWIGGRICCDSVVGVGRLNPKSILLEGTRDSSAGAVVPLDVSQLQRFSFFPGQTVLVQGTNPSGKTFLATKLVTASAAAGSGASAFAATELQEDLSVFVAAGPFTTSDSDAYEPLEDLLNLVKEQKPKVCVLLGPFVDAKNELVTNNNFQSGDGSHDGLFAVALDRVRRCVDSMGGACQCVMIPSARDVHHAFVYPQPPFASNDGNRSIKSFWDPSLLSVGGLLIGATSTDILFHLGAEEISHPPGASDRLARLCAHILAQKSFYPLHPTNEDINVDFSLFERHATFSKRPHLMILPSELKQFVKDVSGVICLNPGRLTKGKTGGTFAKILVPGVKSVSSKTIKSQIVRI